MSAMTDIPAKTPRPMGRTSSFLPGIWNGAAEVEACSAAALTADAGATEMEDAEDTGIMFTLLTGLTATAEEAGGGGATDTADVDAIGGGGGGATDEVVTVVLAGGGGVTMEDVEIEDVVVVTSAGEVVRPVDVTPAEDVARPVDEMLEVSPPVTLVSVWFPKVIVHRFSSRTRLPRIGVRIIRHVSVTVPAGVSKVLVDSTTFGPANCLFTMSDEPVGKACAMAARRRSNLQGRNILGERVGQLVVGKRIKGEEEPVRPQGLLCMASRK